MAKELLKEAIADAKAVREVALENAKMALEEAFDSKIKNMLSAKLAEEIEEDLELEETYMEDEKDEDMKEAYHEDEKDEDMKEGSYDEDEKDEDMKEEFDLEEDEEINLDELMAELEEMGNLEEGKDDEKDEDMKEGKHDEKDEDMKEGKDDEKDEDMKEGQVNELAGLAVIGSIAAAAGGIEALLKKGREGKLEPGSKMEKVYNALEGMAAGAGAARRSEGVEETFDIDALISEIEADLNEETVDEGATGYDEKVGGKGRTGYDEKVGGKGRTGYDGAVKKLKEERDEALETVESLKNTISEMNLLNSKLLYCNKLFRANALTEAQKVKVVDALDKSTTTGEAKLVFETLQESFAFTGVEKRAIKEGLGRASKATGNAPTKVITESVNDTVSRFQKLANINK
jgi:hypothetical protein